MAGFGGLGGISAEHRSTDDHAVQSGCVLSIAAGGRAERIIVGWSEMLWRVLEQRLASLNSRQEEKTTELSDEYRKDVADVQAIALRHAQEREPYARTALSVIAQLGETAVESLANRIATREAVPDTALLMEMVRGVIFAENAVIGYLKAAFNDTRMVPQPPGMRVLEEVEPPHRVCDEAYTALRRILNSESLLRYFVESQHFLMLPEAAKNREIESWSRTGAFTRFLEDIDIEEE